MWSSLDIISDALWGDNITVAQQEVQQELRMVTFRCYNTHYYSALGVPNTQTHYAGKANGSTDRVKC